LTNILIGTPAYGAQVSTRYLSTVLGLFAYFLQSNPRVDVTVKTLTVTAVDLARNLLATSVLADSSITHLLFIDADMGCAPNLVQSMLGFDKPVVGCIYPRRKLDFALMHRVAAAPEEPDELFSLANEYVSYLDAARRDDGSHVIEVTDEGFTRVRAAGTGLMLIKREVFERMKSLPGLWVDSFRLPGWSPGLLQCFKPIDSKWGVPMTEDLSFCRRWIDQCGGEIWANVNEVVSHLGPFEFKGRFQDRLKRGLAVKTDTPIR